MWQNYSLHSIAVNAIYDHKYLIYACTYESVAGLGGSVGCASDWRPGGRGFNPRRGSQHSVVEIDYEIFSTVILSLPLIQEELFFNFWGKNVHNTG